MKYDTELEIACRAVRLACKLCQSVQKKLLSEETASKSDKSPVTVADYGSQVLVSWCLNKLLPNELFSMVAEEDSKDFSKPGGSVMLTRITELVNQTLSETEFAGTSLSEKEVVAAIDRGGSEGGSEGKHWVLDPIDGTRGFMRGEQYAVALGLLDRGEVVLGVLGCPNLPTASIQDGLSAAAQSGLPVGCLFSAQKGAGTTVESVDGKFSPIKVQVSSVNEPIWASFCESYESAHSLQSLTSNIARVLGVVNPPIRIDSQAKYGVMARGDAAIYLRFPHAGYREKIWDHAAGCIVITEAGGLVTDASGKPLDFSKGRFLDLDTGIIASNPALMPVVLAAVKTCLNGEQPS